VSKIYRTYAFYRSYKLAFVSGSGTFFKPKKLNCKI